MSENEAFTNYARYLAQIDQWPSLDKADVSIWSMTPQHALSAFHKLLRWGASQPRTDYSDLRRTPLAMALLEQAVGTKVLYADDLPPAPLGGLAHPLSEVALETVYDALKALEETSNTGSTPLHPITRARIVHAHLTKETT